MGQSPGMRRRNAHMTLKPAHFILAICLLGASLAALADDHPSTRPASRFYEGFAADVTRLRDTQDLKSPRGTIRGSSQQAQEAARRIFSNVAFLHRSRAESLQLLGDPKTISDYGRAAGDAKDAPLVYIFDSGFGGSAYTLRFAQNHCVSVSVETLN